MLREGLIPAGQLVDLGSQLRSQGLSLVFTNGCFDLLHPGHLDLLRAAAAAGDRLMVAINDDASVTRLKGLGQPVYPQDERAEILLGVRWVDYVTIFGEDTPLETITRVRPGVLVKGAEYGEGEIVGEDLVCGYGGVTIRHPMRSGYATSAVVARLASAGKNDSDQKRKEN